MQAPIKEFLADVKSSKKANTYENRRGDLRRFDRYLETEGIDVLEAETYDIHR